MLKCTTFIARTRAFKLEDELSPNMQLGQDHFLSGFVLRPAHSRWKRRGQPQHLIRSSCFTESPRHVSHHVVRIDIVPNRARPRERSRRWPSRVREADGRKPRTKWREGVWAVPQRLGRNHLHQLAANWRHAFSFAFMEQTQTETSLAVLI